MNWLKNPKNRVKAAAFLLVSSLIFMVINVVAYLLHVIDESMLILITLILSWLAITITAADVLATTDVRAKEERKYNKEVKKG